MITQPFVYSTRPRPASKGTNSQLVDGLCLFLCHLWFGVFWAPESVEVTVIQTVEVAANLGSHLLDFPYFFTAVLGCLW